MVADPMEINEYASPEARRLQQEREEAEAEEARLAAEQLPASWTRKR